MSSRIENPVFSGKSNANESIRVYGGSIIENRKILAAQCYIKHAEYFAFLLRTGEYTVDNIVNDGLKICCPCCDQSTNNAHILKEYQTNKDNNILFKQIL